jgi:hypothetical protein
VIGREGIYHIECHDMLEGYPAFLICLYEQLVRGDWARACWQAEDEGVRCCWLEMVDSVCKVISISSSIPAPLVISWISRTNDVVCYILRYRIGVLSDNEPHGGGVQADTSMEIRCAVCLDQLCLWTGCVYVHSED